MINRWLRSGSGGRDLAWKRSGLRIELPGHDGEIGSQGAGCVMKELPVSGCVMKGTTLLVVVSDHPMLRSVVVSDGSKQGRLSMRTEQVEHLRSNLTSAAQLESSSSPDRTPVPALKMTLWHVPVLELPVSGCVMKGATLLVIKPVYGANVAERDGDLVGRVWDGEEEVKEAETMMFGEAAREMMKNKKTYTLEMNSF
ncbi:hypothetical protein U1Q18_040953 [Sarracenia purpurea var. burkii]